MSTHQAIAENKRRTWFILAGFFGFVFTVLYFFARGLGYGPDAWVAALVFSSIGSVVGYWTSDSVVLALSGARPADKKKDFTFFTVMENLCIGARMPMPKLYVIEDTAMNAFATGRDPEHAAVCATTGLLDRLSRTELEGVMAHELSHIKNYDIRLMTVVSVMVGMIALLADFFLRFGGSRRRSDKEEGNLQAIFFIVGIVLALLSPLIAQLIQLAISRNREYLADASGAKLTGYPAGLASALAKLSADKEPLEVANKATAHLYISDPLKNRHDAIGWFSGLFATHPPIIERISRLKSM